LYRRHPDEWKRVETIKGLLLCGSVAFPFFTDKLDQKRKVLIGAHRSIAFIELLAPELPVLQAKYRDN
jgi:hypothetical protein